MVSMKFKHIKYLFSITKTHPSVWMCYTPCLILLSIVGVAIPFLSGRFINALAYNKAPYVALITLMLLMILRALASPMLQRYIFAQSRRMEIDLQCQVLHALMRLHPSELQKNANGELIAKLSRDVYAVGGFIRGAYSRILQSCVMTLVAGGVLFLHSTILATLFLIVLPLVLLAFKPMACRFSERMHSVRIQGDVSFNSLFEYLFALPLMRVLNAEQRFADKPLNALASLKASNDVNDKLGIDLGFLLSLPLVFGEILVLFVAGVLAAKAVIPVGDVVLYQMLFISVVQSVNGVVGLVPEISSVVEGIDSLNEILTSAESDAGSKIVKQVDKIEFNDVSFSYSASAVGDVIKNFNGEFHVGSIVGLLGANGSGKTTLLKLAVNAIKPSSGRVLVNGHDFSEISMPDFRDRIGVVLQESLILPGTIRDNITLRKSRISEDDINKAMRLTGFDAVVRRLPNGLDTIIGFNSRNLSGGESQRLAITRAIVRDPTILILDEATNHLDKDSRQLLLELVRSLKHNRITFIVGHSKDVEEICDEKIFL